MILTIVVFIFAILSPSNNRVNQDSDHKTPLVPWFILIFIIFVLFNSSGILPVWLVSAARQVGVFLTIANLAAIGLNINIRNLSGTFKLLTFNILAVVLQTVLAIGLIKLIF
jgi:uncharacterized membrane protein YadS